MKKRTLNINLQWLVLALVVPLTALTLFNAKPVEAG
jgi:hypothetical protein